MKAKKKMIPLTYVPKVYDNNLFCEMFNQLYICIDMFQIIHRNRAFHSSYNRYVTKKFN